MEFARCLDERRYAADVEADIQQAGALGVDSTPTLIVNGRAIVGPPTVEEFRAIVGAALRGRR